MENFFQIYVAYPIDSNGKLGDLTPHGNPQESLEQCSIIVEKLINDDMNDIQGADIFAKSGNKVWFYDEHESLNRVWFEYRK